MLKVIFSNFIGFGNRMSIDIRCTYFPIAVDSNGAPIGLPDVRCIGSTRQFVISGEDTNTGDCEGIIQVFNDLASRLSADLVVELNRRGIFPLVKELTDRIRFALEEKEGTSIDAQATMAQLTCFFYSLNTETFYVEADPLE